MLARNVGFMFSGSEMNGGTEILCRFSSRPILSHRQLISNGRMATAIHSATVHHLLVIDWVKKYRLRDVLRHHQCVSRHTEELLHRPPKRWVQDTVDHEICRKIYRLHHIRYDLDRQIRVVVGEITVKEIRNVLKDFRRGDQNKKHDDNCYECHRNTDVRFLILVVS